MLKPTATYRMSSANKIRLSKIHDPHIRGAIKRSIIDSDLSAAIQVKKEKPPRNSRNSTPEV